MEKNLENDMETGVIQRVACRAETKKSCLLGV